MTNEQAASAIRAAMTNLAMYYREVDLYDQHRLYIALEMAVKALEEQTQVALYDVEETHDNCTVQVWRNSVTGESSIGWWENG